MKKTKKNKRSKKQFKPIKKRKREKSSMSPQRLLSMTFKKPPHKPTKFFTIQTQTKTNLPLSLSLFLVLKFCIDCHLMEPICTPPLHKSEPTHLTKSSSRLAQIANTDFDTENDRQIPHFSVEFAPSPSPPKRKTPSTTPSRLFIRPRNCIPLQDLLLLSPSPVRKSRTWLSDRLDIVDDQAELRKRCKTRTSSNGIAGCASPRNIRRSRRRIESEDRDLVQVDELVKPRKRTSGRSRKEKTSSVPSSAPSSSFTKEKNAEENALDNVRQLIWDLVMWRDVAKSSLWFGFGCLCFLSSCFTKGLNISFFSVTSQLGLLFLAASFISNTLPQREYAHRNRELKLKEDDILRLVRVVLPALNLVISKTKELFSGEPSMTLKVATFLLFGSEYGHLLTLWRLCALGFFISFTAPKVYTSYSAQIHIKAERCKWKVLEAWRACSHKKIVATSAATAFWNLSSLKTRVFAAFISLVILRYYRQLSESQLDRIETVSAPEAEHQQPKAAIEEKEKETEQALVVCSPEIK